VQGQFSNRAYLSHSQYPEDIIRNKKDRRYRYFHKVEKYARIAFTPI